MTIPAFPFLSNREITPIAAGGLTVANRIADIYRDYSHARVFIVGGSVSRGCADSYSDLEIGVFWDGAIPTEERRDAVSRLGGELWTMDRDGRHMEHFGLYELDNFTGSCMVSMNHNTVAEMEETLQAVLERWETNPDFQELLFAVQHSVPLHGHDLVSAWNERAASFPEELAARIVQENLSFGPWFIPQAYAARNDFLLLNRHFLTIAQHLIRLLLGLNRLYLPSSEFKWLDQTIKRMTITPTRLPERLRTVFQTPDLAFAWRELNALMFETLDLIDIHLPLVNTRSFVPDHPEINTDWARKRWDPLPSYTLMGNVGQGVTVGTGADISGPAFNE
jgi:hypothetical protein